MFPAPVAVGLTICEKVIVEEGTNNVSLISTFSQMRVTEFPARHRPFCVFATLLDGEGDATVSVEISHSETGETVYAVERPISFPSRLTQVHVLFRVNQCDFPSPGVYQVALHVDGDWVAHRLLSVISAEESP
jgi:hypothetical protein